MVQLARDIASRVAVAAFLVVAIAAFGVAAAFAAAPSSVTLSTGSSASLGKFLTAPDGHTLYTLSSDPNNSSTCSGACATAWPPLMVASGGKVTGPSGVSGLSTFSRSDGTTQVAYNGRALYEFIQDTAAGQTTGEGVVAFGGTWHVAAVQGAAMSAEPSAMVGGASGSPAASGSAGTSPAAVGSSGVSPAVASPPATSTTAPSDSNSSPWIPLVLIGLVAAAMAILLVRVRTARR